MAKIRGTKYFLILLAIELLQLCLLLINLNTIGSASKYPLIVFSLFITILQLVFIFKISQKETPQSRAWDALRRIATGKNSRIFQVGTIIAVLFLWVVPLSGVALFLGAITVRYSSFLAFLFFFLVETTLYIRFIQIDFNWSKIISRDPFIKYFIPILVFISPFLFYFRRVVPINKSLQAIGNDFLPISYYYKLYLLDSLSHFYLPLWSPSEAAGFPFFSSPFTQTFYPFNLFLAAFYKLAGGYSILDHTRFTILGISIFGTGLYFWLKETRLPVAVVVYSCLAVSLGFRFSDIIRFPAAVHTAAWIPWILFFTTRILLGKPGRRSILWGAGLIFAIFCLLTGGYPYYWYYLVFLILPFIFFLYLRHFRSNFINAEKSPSFLNILILASSALTAFILCSPYLLNMLVLLQATYHRAGENLAFSTSNSFTIRESIGAFIFPPSANIEGVYYFGAINVLLIGIYFLNQIWPIIRAKKSKLSRDSITTLVLLFIWIIIINDFTFQERSFIFMAFWNYLPFFSNLREWGRVTIILLPIFGFLTALALNDFMERLRKPDQNIQESKLGLIFLTLVYIPFISIQVYLLENRLFSYSWISYLYKFSNQEFYFIITGILSFIFLMLIYIFIKHVGNSRIFFVAYLTIFFVCILDLYPIGSKLWSENNSSSFARRYTVNIKETIPLSFSYPRIDQVDLPLNASFSTGTIPNWHYDNYINFQKRYHLETEAKNELLGMTNGIRLFFTRRIDYSDISGFISDSAISKNIIHVIVYSGEKLVVEIDAPNKGYLSFIDNWDPNWTVTVNGKSQNIELLFSTFKSVSLEDGPSQVVFEYKPQLFPFSQLVSKKSVK